MTTLISVAIGLVTGASLLAACIWWAFRPVPLDGKSILPKALDNREPPDTVAGASGGD